MKSIFACGCLALAAGAAVAQNGVAHGTIFGDVMPQSSVWSTSAGGNNTYFDPGTGTGKVMINTTTPADGSAYLTVQADVAADGWYGMVMQSSTSSGIPYYKYIAGSDSAIHWYNPSNDSWNLSVSGSGSVLRVFSSGYIETAGSLGVAKSVYVDDNVVADRFMLNGTRHDYEWVTKYQPRLANPVGSTYEYIYPVEIPDGAEISGVRMIAVDNNSTKNFSATLFPIDKDGVSGPAVFTVSTSGYNPTAGAKDDFYTSTFVNPVVDTQNYSYVLVISGNNYAYSDLSFETLRIWYTRDEL